MVAHPMLAWSRHEGAQSLDEFVVRQGDHLGAIGVGGLQSEPDVLVVEPLEALVRQWRPGQVAAQPLEGPAVAGCDGDNSAALRLAALARGG